jgi:hypothetical protein
MKLLVLLAGLAFISMQMKMPNYIGMNKTEITSLMNKLNPGFDLDASAKNETYKYLKFVDKYNEETWLFFLSEKDICTRSKLMSDFSNLKNRTNDLNKAYTKAGENKWSYTEKGNTYIVELKKEEWFFTIVTKLKK